MDRPELCLEEQSRASLDLSRHWYQSQRRRRKKKEAEKKRQAKKRNIMEEVYEDDVNTTKWVNIHDEEVKFAKMSIEIEEDLAMDPDLEGEPFDLDDPDEEEYEGYTGNAGPSQEYWYHVAALVIWPKKWTISIMCDDNISEALAVAHHELDACSSASSPASSPPGSLARAYFDTILEKSGQKALSSSLSAGYMNSLLRLCYRWKDFNAIKVVLMMLATVDNQPQQQNPAPRPYFSYQYRYPYSAPSPSRTDSHLGIASVGIAKTIVDIISLFGWVDCQALIEPLIVRSRIGSQAQYVTVLCESLLQENALDACSLILRKTLALSLDIGWNTLPAASCLLPISRLLLRVDEPIFEDSHAEILSQSRRLSTDHLTCLLLSLWKSHQAEITKDRQGKRFEVFATLCKELVQRDFLKDSFATTLSKASADLYRTLVGLCDDGVMTELAKSVITQSRRWHSQSNSQVLLSSIVNSQHVREICATNPTGRLALIMMSSERIRVLERHQKPQFSWEQKHASLPQYPEIEAFLRGPEQRKQFSGFGSLPSARSFRSHYLHGTPCRGYSARGCEGGRGRTAYCIVEKTKHIFDAEFKAWEKDQAELSGLRQMLMKISAKERANAEEIAISLGLVQKTECRTSGESSAQSHPNLATSANKSTSSQRSLFSRGEGAEGQQKRKLQSAAPASKMAVTASPPTAKAHKQTQQPAVQPSPPPALAVDAKKKRPTAQSSITTSSSTFSGAALPGTSSNPSASSSSNSRVAKRRRVPPPGPPVFIDLTLDD